MWCHLCWTRAGCDCSHHSLALPSALFFFFFYLPGSSRSWGLQLSFRGPSVHTDNFNSYPQGVQDLLMDIKHHRVGENKR